MSRQESYLSSAGTGRSRKPSEFSAEELYPDAVAEENVVTYNDFERDFYQMDEMGYAGDEDEIIGRIDDMRTPKFRECLMYLASVNDAEESVNDEYTAMYLKHFGWLHAPNAVSDPRYVDVCIQFEEGDLYGSWTDWDARTPVRFDVANTGYGGLNHYSAAENEFNNFFSEVCEAGHNEPECDGSAYDFWEDELLAFEADLYDGTPHIQDFSQFDALPKQLEHPKMLRKDLRGKREDTPPAFIIAQEKNIRRAQKARRELRENTA